MTWPNWSSNRFDAITEQLDRIEAMVSGGSFDLLTIPQLMAAFDITEAQATNGRDKLGALYRLRLLRGGPGGIGKSE
jgi:hypothetical protein